MEGGGRQGARVGGRKGRGEETRKRLYYYSSGEAILRPPGVLIMAQSLNYFWGCGGGGRGERIYIFRKAESDLCNVDHVKVVRFLDLTAADSGSSY